MSAHSTKLVRSWLMCCNPCPPMALPAADLRTISRESPQPRRPGVKSTRTPHPGDTRRTWGPPSLTHSLPKANIRVSIQVQLLGVLPVTSTWQHSREHNKASGVKMPHGPVQSLNLFPHRRKLLLPWDLPTPAPMIHTVGPQVKGNHSRAAHSNVSGYDSLCSIFECFTTQRVMWPKFVWG